MNKEKLRKIAIEIVENIPLSISSTRRAGNGLRNADEIVDAVLNTLKIFENKPIVWQDIEDCPINTKVLFLIEGIAYAGKVVMHGDTRAYYWYMHTNISSGEVFTKTINSEGQEVRTIIKEEEEVHFQPCCLSYKAGMHHIPTHWVPLPPAPSELS